MKHGQNLGGPYRVGCGGPSMCDHGVMLSWLCDECLPCEAVLEYPHGPRIRLYRGGDGRLKWDRVEINEFDQAEHRIDRLKWIDSKLGNYVPLPDYDEDGEEIRDQGSSYLPSLKAIRVFKQQSEDRRAGIMTTFMEPYEAGQYQFRDMQILPDGYRLRILG